MERMNISSGTVWEEKVGYSRAVRIGNLIEVSGTTAVNEKGEVVGEGDPYLQSVFIIRKILFAILQAGGKPEDIVRTRMYVTNIAHFEEVTKAHAEFFQSIKPASTLVEVSNLVNKNLLVEIEATAWLHS